MGCGESKHAVATENTITRKKSNVAGSSKSKDIKTVDETNQSVTGGNAAEVKEITENQELKEEEEEEEETERLISKESPNRFFSSRKDEDVDGSSASEAKSEFFSPRIESGKESYFDESVNKLDGSVEEEEEKEKLVQDKENEEKTATLKEEEMEKQAKVADKSNIEPEVVATPAIEQMDQKEALAISASKDIKAD